MSNKYKVKSIELVESIGKWTVPYYGKMWKWRSHVLLGCPVCGVVGNLSNHEIDWDDLTISPSVVCPDCNAHYWVQGGKISVI